MIELFTKLLKYSVVGAIGTRLDFGFTWLLKEKFTVNKYVSSCLGFSSGVCSNYVLNRVWTFGSSKAVVPEFILFVVISLVGLGINNLVLWITHKHFEMKFYMSKVIATGIAVLWNFCANYFITFA